MIMEERVKDALHEAEQARLVQTAHNSKGTWSLLHRAMQYLSDWWNGRTSRNQPATEHMRPWKKASKT
jgi:hypothetical protein